MEKTLFTTDYTLRQQTAGVWDEMARYLIPTGLGYLLYPAQRFQLYVPRPHSETLVASAGRTTYAATVEEAPVTSSGLKIDGPICWATYTVGGVVSRLTVSSIVGTTVNLTDNNGGNPLASAGTLAIYYLGASGRVRLVKSTPDLSVDGVIYEDDLEHLHSLNQGDSRNPFMYFANSSLFEEFYLRVELNAPWQFDPAAPNTRIQTRYSPESMDTIRGVLKREGYTQGEAYRLEVASWVV